MPKFCDRDVLTRMTRHEHRRSLSFRGIVKFMPTFATSIKVRCCQGCPPTEATWIMHQTPRSGRLTCDVLWRSSLAPCRLMEREIGPQAHDHLPRSTRRHSTEARPRARPGLPKYVASDTVKAHSPDSRHRPFADRELRSGAYRLQDGRGEDASLFLDDELLRDIERAKPQIPSGMRVSTLGLL